MCLKSGYLFSITLTKKPIFPKHSQETTYQLASTSKKPSFSMDLSTKPTNPPKFQSYLSTFQNYSTYPTISQSIPHLTSSQSSELKVIFFTDF
jgi:hypothetical protein